MRRSLPAWILLLAMIVLSCAPAQGADSADKYALRGAGLTTCKAFVSAFAEKGALAHVYFGWIDGYISGLNELSPTTFDRAPWQSTELLAEVVRRACTKAPDSYFLPSCVPWSPRWPIRRWRVRRKRRSWRWAMIAPWSIQIRSAEHRQGSRRSVTTTVPCTVNSTRSRKPRLSSSRKQRAFRSTGCPVPSHCGPFSSSSSEFRLRRRDVRKGTSSWHPEANRR